MDFLTRTSRLCTKDRIESAGMKQINVYPTPELTPDLPINGTSVAIDVLRATTTITTALRSGAAKVLPFETVEETVAAKETLLSRKPENAENVRLGGERGGTPIPGFDFGNSPDEYTPETVAGKTLLFTTTNGTKAILRCRGTVILACFLNAQAVVERLLRDRPETVSIVCAGTDGQYTEDEYPNRIGFGHSTAVTAQEVMERSRAGQLLLIHHDPLKTDAELLAIEKRIGRDDVRFAREGETICL